MTGHTNAAVVFDNVSIVFGNDPQSALPLMDQGSNREDIKQQTGQVMGVHDADLTVNQGEIMVLMGLSGSGKSTLLRAVNGLNPLARGDVRIWHDEKMVSVTNCSRRDLRDLRLRQVAMVFQQFGLLPWRSVRENVGLGLELAGMNTAARREKVDAELETVGLAEWADLKVEELSGGMQQRVGLARAFATDAPILLMDEPFSALDPLIRARLQDELLEMQDKKQRTIIFVSHDLDEAFKIGNRIALMEGGHIVQTGTARDIIANPVNEYVADFVAHMNPLMILTAGDASEPGEATGTPVSRDMPMRNVMALLKGDVRDLPLKGGGRISCGSIMARLLNPQG